jgi:beta-glucosidase
VVVLTNGSALAINWAQQHADAILEAWYPGEEGGTAIAQTLAGTNNPAGRLPLTFYSSTDQLPSFEDYSMTKRTYRYFDGQPLYGFGYGLSYSSFGYSNLKLSGTSVHAGQPITVEADVKNLSARPGDEVVEVYLTQPKAALTANRTLAGFTRIHLEASQTTHVALQLDPRVLSQVNEKGERIILPGDYTVSVGGSQPDSPNDHISGSFSVTGQVGLAR